MYTFNGTEYKSILAACLANGADYYRVRRRVAQGWSLSNAITAPSYARKPLSVASMTLYNINQASYASAKDAHSQILHIARMVRDYLKEHDRV